VSHLAYCGSKASGAGGALTGEEGGWVLYRVGRCHGRGVGRGCGYGGGGGRDRAELTAPAATRRLFAVCPGGARDTAVVVGSPAVSAAAAAPLILSVQETF